MSLYSDWFCIFCILHFFENLPVLPLLIKLAALGNMKASFHCAHLHNLSPQGTGDVPTALLGAFFENLPVLPYP